MNSLARLPLRLPRSSPAWTYLPCSRATIRLATMPWRLSVRTATTDAKPKPSPPQHSITPSMDQVHEYYKLKNRTVMNYVISVILATLTLAYGSVPLYKMICATTGWGGQPIRTHGYTLPDGQDPSTRMIPVQDAKRIKVTFNACVSDILPWKFVPLQHEVKVLPGETALAFYKATNRSEKDIIGVATYSVTPAQVAPYFSKIQCFCFEEQRLCAGEEVDMPVFFYLDPDLLNDLNMRGVETVTLNYTFFKARYDDNGKIEGLPKEPVNMNA